MEEYFSLTEIVGYAASLVILLSFLMKDVIKLRLVYVIGCSLFVVYGIFLDYSIPLIVTNVSIAIINVVFLIKAKNGAKQSDISA